MKNFSNKGFTIVETLIAIAVMMTAITGPLTISQRGLNAATIARDQFVAQYLAQDAIEYFYYLRDKNNLSGNKSSNQNDPNYWLSGMHGPDVIGQECPITGASGCVIDTVAPDNNFKKIPDNETQIESMPKLYLKYGLFTHDPTGTPTHFKRVVYVDPVTVDEVIVTAIVSWSNGKNENHVTISKNVYNR